MSTLFVAVIFFCRRYQSLSLRAGGRAILEKKKDTAEFKKKLRETPELEVKLK
jgi:hypothetical protein